MAPDIALPLAGCYGEIRYRSWKIRVAETNISVSSGFNLSFSGMMLTAKEEHN
jgi:hypothetical protein